MYVIDDAGKVYKSMASAARANGVHRNSISYAVRRGSVCCGKRWRQFGEQQEIAAYRRNRPVRVYRPGGELLDNATDAAKFLGVATQHVYSAIAGGKLLRGVLLRYEEPAT